MTPTPTDTQPEAPTVPDSERKGGCSAMAGSVIRVRYMVEIQSLGGIWQNLATRETEFGARKEMGEWESWLTKSRKTWKDIRIVKETTTVEVLQNVKMQQPRQETPVP